MTESANSAPRRRSFSWLMALTIFYTVSLLGWPFAFMMVGMASSDYVGTIIPHRIAGDSIPSLLALAYPFVGIIGLFCAWSLHNRQSYRAAFWVSLIPIADILLVILSLTLLVRAIRAIQGIRP